MGREYIEWSNKLFTRKNLWRFGALMLLFGLTLPLYAKDELTVQSEERRVEHPQGAQTKGLREYGFWERKTQFGSARNLAEAIYNSAIYAWYETNSMKDIESYAFVKYIRGCVFVSEMGSDGKINRGLGVTRWHFGKRIVFVHPEWVIDADDKLPIHGSSPYTPLLTHHFMEWGVPQGIFPNGSYQTYGDDPPREPRLHFMESVSVPAHLESTFDTQTAVNHSLEFRTCLYRTKDIPAFVDKKNFIPHPIDCFSSSSSYIYDFTAKKFKSEKHIASICRPEIIPSPEQQWELK